MFFGFADPADTDAGTGTGTGTGWQRAELLYGLRDGPLDDLVELVRVRLGGCERRVAASLFYQGYAARLLSPQVGCLAMSGCVPEVSSGLLLWRQPDTELIELALRSGAGWQGSPGSLIELIISQSFGEHLRPLAAALRARVRISAGLLRDNAASALVSALRLAENRAADGDLAEVGWRPLADHCLAQPELRGSGVLRSAEPAFVRRSCCLFYRTANGGKCGDCPIS